MALFYDIGVLVLTGIIILVKSEECVDKLPECKRLSPEICSDPNYVKFVTENCCEFCSTSHTERPFTTQTYTIKDQFEIQSQGACTDLESNCKELGTDVCTAPFFVQWALQKCRKTCNLCNGIPSTVSALPVTTPSASSSTTPEQCVDKKDDCHLYSPNDCIKYAAWAKDNCRKYCSLCGDVQCQDGIVNCVDYGQGACSKYPKWAADNCAKYCNLCPDQTTAMIVPTTTAPSIKGCIDKLANCKDYGSGVCADHKYAQWARENCALFCNMCTPGCYYNGKIYKQSEVFRQDCKMKCTCHDATLGQFSCTSMCYSWTLPDICTLEPPKPGKCCSTPKCPDNVHIRYPDGYIEE